MLIHAAFFGLLTAHASFATPLNALQDRAATGEATAQRELAMAYMTGNGTDVDYIQAREWFAKAAEQGDALAQANLGSLLVFAKGGPKDVKGGVDWFEKAIAQNNSAAQYNYAILLEDGKRVKKDIAQAIALYEQAALNPTYSAPQFRLGEIYRTSKVGRVELKLAAHWYRKAALRGHAQAQYEYARLVETGHGETSDPWQAQLFNALAAQKGDKRAVNKAVELKQSTGLNLDKPLRDALPRFVAREPGAFFKVASSYLFGVYKTDRIAKDVDITQLSKNFEEGMDQLGLLVEKSNFPRARLLYEIALEHGYSAGAFYLGVSYLRDDGPDHNPAQAKHYFTLAEQGGIFEATHNLGWMYESGQLGQVDLKRALSHYQSAAKHNVIASSYQLGIMALLGREQKQNLNTALNYFEVAMHNSAPTDPYTQQTIALAGFRHLRVKQEIDRLTGKQSPSDEGFFFHKNGVENPLSEPITKSIGLISAKLEFCEFSGPSEKFRNSVNAYLDQALSPQGADTLRQRIKDAFKAEYNRLHVFVQQDTCPVGLLSKLADHVVELVQYDWGFKEQSTTSEQIFNIDGTRFLVGNIPLSEKPSRSFGPYITRLRSY